MGSSVQSLEPAFLHIWIDCARTAGDRRVIAAAKALMNIILMDKLKMNFLKRLLELQRAQGGLRRFKY
jgi:hypothetical protein